MFYLALPPVPPIISISLQSHQFAEKTLIQKLVSTQNSKNTVAVDSVNIDHPTFTNPQNLDLPSDNTEIQNSHLEISSIDNENYELDILFANNQAFSSENISHHLSDIIYLLDIVSFSNSSVQNVNSTNLQTVNEQPQSLISNSTNSLSTHQKSVTEIKSVRNGTSESEKIDSTNLVQNIKDVGGTFLVGVIINRQEVGSLEIRLDGDTILVPLVEFAELTDIKIENLDSKTLINTPLGVVEISSNSLRKIDGVTYISDALIKEKIATPIEFKAADLALNVNLPWRQGGQTSGQTAADLKPEALPPSNTVSSLRQELYFYRNSGDNSLRSSTLLGGRLGGGSWRVRLNNSFESAPYLSEYFYYKRQGQFLYQVGQQQVGINPLLSGINLTGVQLGFTNIPVDKFSQNNSAAELLPRRSQPSQSFRGEAPPASLVQLRVAGTVVAQQQVGLNGKYEFADIRLPANNSNLVELLVYDRNNLDVPVEIRSLTLNTSDLLLPTGGNVQLVGLGFNGNLIQNTLFDDFDGDKGNPVGFYQFRQGLSENLTFEGGVQLVPDTVQAEAGFVWRLADPVILATSLGTSRGQLGYLTDLNIDFGDFEIVGNSQLFPDGYYSNNQSRDRYNHSLETNYRINNRFRLGFIARSYQDGGNSSNYILPTFSMSPFSRFSLSGRPDFEGRYLFNAFYYPTTATRLSFSTFGDIYTSNFTQKLNRQYQLSLGGEFGGDLDSRYTATLNYNALKLGGLNWRLGFAYSDGDVGPIVGADMQILPGLHARVDYQGIPSRTRSLIQGIGDERLTISLISDLSFAGGNVTPARFSGLGRERGAIAGKIVIEGENKDFDLDGAIIRVTNTRNGKISAIKTDSFGSFFVGNLQEGIYVVNIDPDQLPVELSTLKNTIVAEVASSAVTRLNFPVREEYGMAGKITDAAGQPVAEVKVELIGADGKTVTSGMTDEFGFYRFDNVPVGKYTIQVPSQDATTPSDNLPKRVVQIKNEFVFDQNLQLPISAAAKKK
ncbi:Cna B-type [Fischerella thermalis CCMEE 5268]|uniref:Cna B-type n=1 Tax=Fischerella thermalis CCMEE 5268 TaxID=2019662 RepID=A0A2N6KJF6_9CYAN|nr:carboxypeptidase regulatory-like domain-containing protein [Fischerella thermalis]PLZ99747.1 Cna B-type [Fischerella thermalis CCMEE 5268]